MADKEIGFDIPISAYADKNSAKEAANDLTKGVLSSLKDGYVEIPAKVKTTYERGSKELKKAQADVITEWEKMSREGFSSSGKYLDELVEKYKTFRSLAGKEGKGNSKQFKWIKENIGATLEPYIEQKKELDRIVKSFESTVKDVKKVTKSSGTRRRTKDVTTTSPDNQKRTSRNIRQTGPKGYGSGWIDPSRTNEREAKLSEVSSYSSNMARQVRQSERETRKGAKESLISDKYATKAELDAELNKRRATDTIRGTNKNLLSPEQKAGQLSEDLRKNILPDLLNKLQLTTNSEDVEKITQKFFATLETISKLSQDAGKLIFSDVKKNIGFTMGNLGFSTKGNIGGTEGGDKTASSKDPKIEALLKNLLNKVAKKEEDIRQELIKLSQLESSSRTSRSNEEINSLANRLINETRASRSEQNQHSKEISQAIARNTTATNTQSSYDRIENSAERVADSAEAKKNQDIISDLDKDLGTGFNTDSKAQEAIDAMRDKSTGEEDFPANKVKEVLSNLGQAPLDGGKCPCEAILETISDNVRAIAKKMGAVTTSRKRKTTENVDIADTIKDVLAPVQPALASVNQALLPPPKPVPVPGTFKNYYEGKDIVQNQRRQKEIIEEALNSRAAKNEQDRVPISNVTTSDLNRTLRDTLKDVFGRATAQSEVDRIMSMNAEEQAKLRAERIDKYGLNRGRDLTDTGDIAGVRRTKELFGWNYKSDKTNKQLFQDVKLTPGVDIDTTAIMRSLNKVLSGPEMFRAQTGGILRNILGSMTGYIGMPSLEKSRAEAEGLNQVMANVRSEVLKLVQEIQAKEMTLHGMEQTGTAKIVDGRLTDDSSSSARKLFSDLEEQKGVLRGVLAEVAMVDKIVDHTGGSVHGIVKNLGFVMPELMQNNTILQNINAGLDKNGKALKFQTRLAEVLNYTFQLMARHIGQMIKNWLMMLNPLTWIKKAFQDFASYDTKWQRTMNVIKYNLRRIIRPFMEWLAQQIVNIIGLVNALMKGIGKAFGQNWDLFDQNAASEEKLNEELDKTKEKIDSITAGFDELHDISSELNKDDEVDENSADNLLGDIYKPQWDDLYKSIEDFGKKIGDMIKGLKDLTDGWDFWKWLAIAGAALLGLLALRWLIGLFSHKNPLQSVADGFSFLEKAVGWALLIWAFSEFTKQLKEFIDVVGHMDPGEVVQALAALAFGFALLVVAVGALEYFTLMTNTSAGKLVGLSALVFAFDGFVAAIVPFIECIKDLGKEKLEVISASIITLVLAFAALVGAVWGLEKVSENTKLMSDQFIGLALVVGALDLFVAAITPFIKVISEIEGDKWQTIIPALFGLVGAFVALAVGVGLVSKMFKTMDWTGILQLYAVAGVFELFMYALIPYLYAIQDIPTDKIAVGLGLLAVAFIALGGAVALMAPAIKALDILSFVELLVVLAAFAGLIWVIKEFATALKDLTAEQLTAGLKLLAIGLITVAAAIAALALVFTTVVTTGIGAVAIVLLALVLGMIALVILALTEFVKALGEAGEGIKLTCEGISEVVTAIGEAISQFVLTIATSIMMILQTIGGIIIGIITAIMTGISTIITTVATSIVIVIQGIATAFQTVGETICMIVETIAAAIAVIVESIATGIAAILEPILSLIDSVIGKVLDLAATIAHEIGEVITTVIQTVGDVIIGIINTIMNAVPNLLNSILNFCGNIGPAIERTADSIMNTIKKVVNFTVSAVEYLINLVIDGVNSLADSVGGGMSMLGIQIPRAQPVSIRRFTPQYEQGTNYVPNDGLAYLHQGEAVIPKKYNTPYQSQDNSGLKDAITALTRQVTQISDKVNQGIPVKGQFIQRGSDLVAAVQRADNKLSNNVLNNKVYAR